MDEEISKDEISKLYKRLDREAEQGGYHLNPDKGFTKDLVKGLIVNKKRYGYWACPCRLASGDKIEDLDIICPCDYRDADILEHGACYCALYVSKEIKDKNKDVESIPERRPDTKKERAQFKSKKPKPISKDGDLEYPVWRCRVCGYLCSRDKPPEVCPICYAKKERFERYLK
ncbi:MAG: ferredoxin-thioredoxin reductase catalytic domain-containing protein [Candidatus Thermoplasmatota archaeon]|nr:ferredoxin-thioredoxin reductase catalytic domain-containing protein [Candidatus Thermoplasmatota archaeon]